MRFVINPFTDKLDVSSIMGSGQPQVEFITGNSGGPVGPNPGTFTLNLLGDNTTGLNVVGNSATYTLTIFGLASSTTQVGTTRYATNAEAAAQTLATAALTPANITSLFSSTPLPSSQGGTGRSSPAAHQLIVTNGSSPYTLLGVAGNGQIPIGSLASDPVLANITSSGATVVITNGPGSIDLAVSGSKVGQTITGQSGGALSPTAGNWNISGASTAPGTSPVVTSGSVSTLTVNVQKSQAIAATDATKVGLANFDSAAFSVDANGFVTLKGGGLAIDSISPNSGTDPVVPDANGKVSLLGTGSITAVGSLNTETFQLTGLTNHAVLLGAGTATITSLGPTATAGQVLQSAGSGADPAFSTATYPLTTTINQLLFSSAANTVTGLASANRAVLTTSSTGVPVMTAINGNGLLIIGSASSQPAAANLTAGAGISIVNGANSITISLSGGGVGIDSISPNSGTDPVVADVNGKISLLGSGSITAVGSLNTETFSLTGLTNHNLLIGAGTDTITNVAPSATSGIPVISQGASADPTFGTAVVAGGGTGKTTQTAYSLVAGGTTTTGAFQAVGPDASTHSILYGQGSSTLPAFLTNGTPYVSGISFNSGTNTLDAYTTGNMSPLPAIQFGGAAVGITYGVQLGIYWKVGKLVFFNIQLVLTSKGSSTGNATIVNFPFTSGTGDATYAILGVAVTYPASCTNLMAILGNSTTTANLYGSGSGAFANLTNTQMANNSTIQLTGLYWTA